jgi:sulfur-carrier protein
MMVRVKLFAAARDVAGTKELTVDVNDTATLADVRQEILRTSPGLAALVPHARWAVDSEFVAESKLVGQESEIALIPPVSGG